MSAAAAPFGLRPSFHAGGGIIRPVEATILTGYASNIYQGSPVGYIADGTIALAPAAGTGITGAVGVFQGCEYTDTLGKRTYSPRWPASQAATDIIAWLTTDPQIVYDIQATSALTLAAIGSQYDWTANGSTNGTLMTGLSSVGLDTTAAANNGLRVIGLTRAPDNAWGDAYPIVQVQFSEHQFVATIAQI